MSRKRARRNNITTASTTPPEDTSAIVRVVQNSALQLPTELIYNILAIAIGEYMGDMMLRPNNILQWDAIMTSLHVSRTFRGCTIKLLYHLWGDTFIRDSERTRYALLCGFSLSPTTRAPSLTRYIASLETTNPRTPSFASSLARHAGRHTASSPETTNRSCSPRALCVTRYPPSRESGLCSSATRPWRTPCFWTPKRTGDASTLRTCTRRRTCR
ncbi:hypothetical protein BC827DRAFT_460864 [Russula dissimulans]|nr:hypothetical protein BC827DRAFT_460864 [Russula dissimulans]